MNQTAAGFQCNSNSPPSVFNLNNQTMFDGGFYSTSSDAKTPSFQSASLSSDSSDVAAAASEYSGTANATMSSFQNSHAASVPSTRQMSTPSFTPNQESRIFNQLPSMSPYATDAATYQTSMIQPSEEGFITGGGFGTYANRRPNQESRDLNHFSSMRSFATDAATYQTNVTDKYMSQPIDEEGFITGGSFNTYNYSRAEYSSNEHPTFEYLQRFFGIKPKDKPEEEPPSGRNSYWY
jgi:hypothetical protein